LQPELKRKAFTILASRPSWSKALLSGLGHKGASVREVPLEVVAALRASHDPEVRDMAERIWGKSQTPSETKQRRVQELTQRLAETKGNPETGQALFTLLCANCHTLFGTGGQIGPDLTGIDRQNRAYLLRSIIAPSEVILPEFQGVQVVLKSAGNEDARVITGFIENQNANTVWLKDSAGTRVVLAREKMDRIDPMQVSIMPEGLLDPLTDHQVADLFAYLQSRSSP
jgi:putative heme-binding domain-containing protein